MNKNESKYFNTAKRMDEALITLLAKKDFAYITIKEICDLADVNRSTFYLHYENTSDLLKEATRYILDTFLSYFSVDTEDLEEYYRQCDLSELLFITPRYITPYLTFIQENKMLFQTALRQFGSMDFEGVYKRMFQRIFSPILYRFNIPQDRHAYMMKFYLSGITAVAMEWLVNGCEDDIQTVVEVIIDCVMRGRNIREESR